MLEKDEDDTYSDDFIMNPGIHAGVIANMPINDLLSFEPGILFTTKGSKYKDETVEWDWDSKVNLYYLDVPLTLKATQDMGSGLKVFGAAGPYVGFGLSGKYNYTSTFQGEEESKEEDVEWGNDEDEDDLKRPDLGITFGGGVQIKSMLIGISYDLGLSNISAYQGEGTTTKNRVLKLSVGYLF